MRIKPNHDSNGVTRRQFLQGTAAMGLLTGLDALAPAYAWQKQGNLVAGKRASAQEDVFDLEIAGKPMTIWGRPARPITINGSIPGPLVRLREGREAVLRVTNRLDEDTSVHWHGLQLPNAMDGVPGGHLCRDQAGRDLRLSVSGPPERHLLVSQPFRAAGAARALRATDHRSGRAGVRRARPRLCGHALRLDLS
jgi:hypothetical protein